MEVLVMALRDLVAMTDEQRAERRENDEAAFHAVEAFCSTGLERSKALTKAASSLRAPRNDVIAGYWRHVKRKGKR
jgi:hypothetical protein